jgi:preprotein translocase subunit SecG
VLAVFQCVTLEGWSEIQRQMQQTFSYAIFLFFVPLVLIGAFFLLNLTLAVINSKFTEEHKKQQTKDLNEMNKIKSKLHQGDNELEMAMKSKDEMSIAQYITARIYAKKMIEFLRMRQEIKRIENERMQKVKAQQKAEKMQRRVIVGQKAAPPRKTSVQAKAVDILSPQSSSNGGKSIELQKALSNQAPSKSDQLGTNVIKEEEEEQHDDHSEQEQLDKEI